MPDAAERDHFDAWLSAALKRQHADVLAEALPDALLRLLDEPDAAPIRTGPGSPRPRRG